MNLHHIMHGQRFHELQASMHGLVMSLTPSKTLNDHGRSRTTSVTDRRDTLLSRFKRVDEGHDNTAA